MSRLYRYLNDVLADGTADQRAVAQTALKLMEAAPAVPAAKLDALHAAILDALRHHHMTHTVVDEDNALPLVDMLNPRGDEDITRGKEEMEYLADAILNAVELFASRAAVPAAGGGDAIERAISAFEERERGIPQAQMAMKLVAEIRAALAALPSRGAGADAGRSAMTSKASAYGPATIDYVPEMPKVDGFEVEHLDSICEFLWFQELCRRADNDWSYRATEPGVI